AEAIGVVTDMADHGAVQQLAHRTYETLGAADIVLLNQMAMDTRDTACSRWSPRRLDDCFLVHGIRPSCFL
ncbi:MAG TPA: hypothetical protein VFP27_15520, partial [Mycobacterium sp.]|nr:hypothetical protein [Mycobacterium sp.]